MNSSSSTSSWTRIEKPILSQIERSTEAIEIAKENWPSWTNGSTQFNRILAYSLPEKQNIKSTLPSSTLTLLLTERIDIKDYPNIYNYNFYLVAETTNGELYQSKPITPSDPIHHSSKPSTWFDNLGEPK